VRAGAVALRGLGVLLLLLLLAAGFMGEAGDWDANLLPVAVWVLWWVGLAFACALLGDLWRPLEPWGAVPPCRYAALGRLQRPVRALRAALAQLGAWPAVALFLAFSWAELVWTSNAQPRALAALVLAYAVLAGVGSALLGRTLWRRRFDPFTRFFALFARLAPLAWQAQPDGSLRWALRWPGAGLDLDRLPTRAETAFVVAALSTVAFDGVAETPFWEAVMGTALAGLYAMGLVQRIGYELAGMVVKTAGLLASPVLFAWVYGAFCAWTGRLVGESAQTVARRFVLSLVPIAVGYHLAHYLAYLLIQGQAALPLLSDPLALGWDLFGTRAREIDIAVIDMRTVWAFALAAIVGGHVCAVVVAHREARRAYGPQATRSQGPMLVLMIGYTMSSLWILSQPIVEG
jgi:hypothetical protein